MHINDKIYNELNKNNHIGLAEKPLFISQML